jgi:protein-arginine kinase activator protein McsA
MTQYCPFDKSLMVFIDNNSTPATYVCLTCAHQEPVKGDNSLLRVEVYRGHDNLSNYISLLSSLSFDPTNMRVQTPCKSCHMTYMSFCMAGQQEKPYLTCTCGAIYFIDQLNLNEEVKGSL